jgi:hypothetical protein
MTFTSLFCFWQHTAFIFVWAYNFKSLIFLYQAYCYLIEIQFLRWKAQQDATVYQNLLLLIWSEAQHVSGDTPPIISSLKLQK